MALRRRAGLAVICDTLVAVLAFIPLHCFFTEKPVVRGTGVLLNLPDTIMSVVIWVAGHDFLPADANPGA